MCLPLPFRQQWKTRYTVPSESQARNARNDLPGRGCSRAVGNVAVFALKALRIAYFLHIHTSHVSGPASLSLIGVPTALRASFICP
jgi:hypothetical protein